MGRQPSETLIAALHATEREQGSIKGLKLKIENLTPKKGRVSAAVGTRWGELWENLLPLFLTDH